MDLSSIFGHPLEIAIAAVVAWVIALEMRVRGQSAKIIKMQEGKVDDAIVKKVIAMSDDQLNRDLARKLDGAGSVTKP